VIDGAEARNSRPRSAGWWLAAASAPAAAILSALVMGGHSRPWFDLSRVARVHLNADALVLQTVFVVIGAPLAGVAVAASRLRKLVVINRAETLRSLWSIAWAIGTGVTVFAATSAVLALAVMGTTAGLPLLIISRATLWAATLALAALGAVCASSFSDPLDAAGCALALAFVVAAGVLVVGPAAAGAPTSVINAALLASPIVAIASAADIDILRGDVLYRLSPLAHIRFDYPAWQTAVGIYVTVGFACFTAMALNINRMGRTRPAGRMIS
jgi:hypothetical protein